MYQPDSEVEVQLTNVTDLPPCAPDTLMQASLDEGFDFVARTLDEWVEGKNRQVGKFYEAFGFRPTRSESECTHIMDLQSTA